MSGNTYNCDVAAAADELPIQGGRHFEQIIRENLPEFGGIPSKQYQVLETMGISLEDNKCVSQNLNFDLN